MKNTILRNISELLCPHNCISCGKTGGILCDCCKNYIIDKHEPKCLNCGEWLVNNVCLKCLLPFCEQFCVGMREGALKDLISVYKYQSVRAVSFELADLLGSVVNGDYVLVPLPTIRRHIRERGFDHIGLICRKVGLPVERALVRRNNTVQVGASNEKRCEQAARAYEARDMDAEKRYLLVDDVWTTGSSMMAACEAMRKKGAKNLAIAVIARSEAN